MSIELTDEFYTPREVADMLKVHINTVHNYMNDGRLKYVQLNRAQRIPKSAIEALIIDKTVDNSEGCNE